MEKIKEKHVRFYIDMTEAEDDTLHRLSTILSGEIGIRVTRAHAIRMAVKYMARKKGV